MAYILRSLVEKYKNSQPHFIEMTYFYNLELKSSLLTFGARSLKSYNFDGKILLLKSLSYIQFCVH